MSGQAVAAGNGIPMVGQGDLILALPGNLPFLSGDLRVLAHREPGAGLAEGARIGMRKRIDASSEAHLDPVPGDGLGHL